MESPPTFPTPLYFVTNGIGHFASGFIDGIDEPLPQAFSSGYGRTNNGSRLAIVCVGFHGVAINMKKYSLLVVFTSGE